MNNLHIFKTQHPIIQRDSLCSGTENIYIQTNGWMHMPCWHLRLFSNKEATAICQKTQIKWNCHHTVSSCSPSLSLSLQHLQPDRRKMKIFATQIGFALMKVISLRTKSRIIHEIRINSDFSWSSFPPASVSRVPASPGGWCLLYCVSLNNRTMFDNRSTCSDDGASPQG